MSARAGYSAELMESLGKCRHCGGSKSYPMLITADKQIICRAKFHTVRFRIASTIYKWIMKEELKQP